MRPISKENRSVIIGIKIIIRTAVKNFKNVGALGMQNSERIVEAKAELMRAEKKLKAILDSGDKVED